MSRNHSSPPRIGIVGAAAAAIALVVVVLFAAPSHAATGRGCSGAVSAGSAKGILLRATGLRVTDVGCRRAHTVVRAYLRKKLSQHNERCAGSAENPPFTGCRVDGYRCRDTRVVRRPPYPEICTDGRRRIRFSERDSTHA